MKWFLLLVALLFLAGIYMIRRAASGNSQRVYSRIKLVITVKDQEPWVEGFIRKLFFCVKKKSGLDVVIVDDFSYDRTPDILKRLARVYPFKFNTSGSCEQERDYAGACTLT